jgi:hypothetical protein
MNYIQFLERLHDARSDVGLYFEIGCRQGRSLSISRAESSIGVDPAFNITWPIRSPCRLFKMTSDHFFEKHAAKVLTRPIDMAFIDGMHLSEFALRDFINVERYCHGNSWVVIDDVLPNRTEIASRTRNTQEWAGDVYKLTSILKRYRPDLDVTVFDVDVKGLMLVQGLDPSSKVLADHYADIEKDLLEFDNPAISVSSMREIAQPVPPESFGVVS